MLLAFRCNFRRVVSVLHSSCRGCVRGYSELPDRDKPVKYTTSEAAEWRAEFTRSGTTHDMPDAQPIIVSISTAIFLLYFLWYREESDVDERLYLSEDNLYERVPGMEEVQLKLLRNHKLRNGEDVRNIDERLKELERIRLEEG